MIRHESATLRRLAKWLLWFTVAVFVLYLVIYVVYAVALFRFPYDYDQGEGFELNDSLLFLQGQWPYRSNEVFPFYASNYPPLFHWLVMPLFAIFGPTLTGRARVVVCGHAVDCGARRLGGLRQDARQTHRGDLRPDGAGLQLHLSRGAVVPAAHD